MENLKYELDKLVDEGWVNRQKHPNLDLYIYNYSQATQFEKYWNEYTIMCRGLILDGDGTIIAKPFSKFFNVGEHSPGEIPYGEDFIVTEKMDGSLGIGFLYNDEFMVATRGSFTSEQAIFAKKFLDERIKLPHSFDGNLTFLFEIIYPENRIVCDYNGETRMTLLAVIENETGNEYSNKFMNEIYDDVFTDIVEQHTINDLKDINSLERDNSEGVVIRFESGFRVKVKWEEYVRLHRIVTGVSTKTVWEYMKEGKDFKELIEKVPDEFYEWIRKTQTNLHFKYDHYVTQVGLWYDDWLDVYKTEDSDRKEYAMWLKNHVPSKWHSALWKRYDCRDFSEVIWKAIEPEFEKPFQNKQIVSN